MTALAEEVGDILSTVLLKAEVALEAEATTFVTEQVPDPTEVDVCRAWIRNNIDLQERLNTLKLGVQTRLRRKMADLKKTEAAICEELKDEGFRSYEERSVMCHREARYRDGAAETGDLETLFARLDFLEWSLKNLMRFVTK